MRRIGLVLALTLGLTIAPLHVEGQQPAKAVRIGYLSPLSGSADSVYTEAFRQVCASSATLKGKVW